MAATGDLTGEDAGEAVVWPWSGSSKAASLQTGGPIAYAEFSAGGSRLLTADGGENATCGAVRIWKVQPPTATDPLEVSAATAPLDCRGAVVRAHFSPDGQWVAGGSRDRTARVWHISTEQEVLSLPHQGEVNDVAFSPDGRFLATAGRDRTACLWEIATGQRLLPALDHGETVSEVAFLPSGRRLLTAAKNLIHVWDLDQRVPSAPILASRQSLAVGVSPDGQHFCTVSAREAASQKLELWDTVSGRGVAGTTVIGGGRGFRLALNAKATRMALVTSGTSDPDAPMSNAWGLEIFAHEPGDGEKLRSLPIKGNQMPDGPVVLLAIAPDRDRVAVALRDPTDSRKSSAALYDWGTGRLLPLPRTMPVAANSLQFSPRGDYLLECYTVAESGAGIGRIWPLDEKGAGEPFEVSHETAITTAAFSPRGDALLTGSTDDTAWLWPIKDRRIVKGDGRMLLGREAKEGAHTHTADVTKVLFSQDGRRAVTAAKDQTAIVWQIDELGKAHKIAVLPHAARVSDVAFDESGLLVLTSSEEPKVRVWSASNGKLVALFTPVGSVLQSGFTAKNERVFAIGQNFANHSQRDRGPGDRNQEESVVREVRPMTWHLQFPEREKSEHLAALGQLVAARQASEHGLEKLELPLWDIWNAEEKTYAGLFDPALDAPAFHRREARECEATEQWSAAAWHLSKLLALPPGPADGDRVAWLERRAAANAATDNPLRDLPKSLEDRSELVELAAARATALTAAAGEPLARAQRASAARLRERAEIYLRYGDTQRELPARRAQFALAITDLKAAKALAPKEADYPLLLGEALAGLREYAAALPELEEALRLKHPSARGRLALVNWLAGNREEYCKHCQVLKETKESTIEHSLIWPIVLTPEFAVPPNSPTGTFAELVAAKAGLLHDGKPANLYRHNNFGAALFRFGEYESAIKELTGARDAYVAERVAELARRYDHLIRDPVARPAEGRPQDWLFLAMACAKLYESDPQTQLARQTEMWDWMRKAQGAPELAYLRDQQRSRALPGENKAAYPVMYETLAVELLYDEAITLLRGLATTGGTAKSALLIETPRPANDPVK